MPRYLDTAAQGVGGGGGLQVHGVGPEQGGEQQRGGEAGVLARPSLHRGLRPAQLQQHRARAAGLVPEHVLAQHLDRGEVDREVDTR